MMVTIDFRLFQVEVELETLQEHLNAIEVQILHGEDDAQSALDMQLSELRPQDQGDRKLARDAYDFQVKVVLPRIMRNPFLVSLFAVYESSVREVAYLLQKKQAIGISLDDLKGSFLERAEKYYGTVLKFDLTKETQSLDGLRTLAKLRNAVAHRNGRLDIDQGGDALVKAEGVVRVYDFMIVDENLVRELFSLVKTELEHLVDRYKAWDTANSH